MSETFVLIHGSWHGGWAWQAVIRHLEARGHHTYAPTLAGHGPTDERVGIAHQDCVDSVVSYIRQHDLQDVILVGHSVGGTVISKVAEYLPNRIKRLVFLLNPIPQKVVGIHETSASSRAQTSDLTRAVDSGDAASASETLPPSPCVQGARQRKTALRTRMSGGGWETG